MLVKLGRVSEADSLVEEAGRQANKVRPGRLLRGSF